MVKKIQQNLVVNVLHLFFAGSVVRSAQQQPESMPSFAGHSTTTTQLVTHCSMHPCDATHHRRDGTAQEKEGTSNMLRLNLIDTPGHSDFAAEVRDRS